MKKRLLQSIKFLLGLILSTIGLISVPILIGTIPDLIAGRTIPTGDIDYLIALWSIGIIVIVVMILLFRYIRWLITGKW